MGARYRDANLYLRASHFYGDSPGKEFSPRGTWRTSAADSVSCCNKNSHFTIRIPYIWTDLSLFGELVGVLKIKQRRKIVKINSSDNR